MTVLPKESRESQASILGICAFAGSQPFVTQGRSQKKIMTEAMSMVKTMTEAMSMVKFSS